MILNRQRRVRVPVKELNEFLARARRALRLPAESVSVCLVTNAKISRWNRAYRGKTGPTDVLSFSVRENNGMRHKSGKPRKSAARNPRRFSSDSFGSSALFHCYLGDIAIAPAVARHNARRFRRTFSQEMRILILHGMLHLMGYDHETDCGEMDRREQHLRRSLGLA